jgi:hypothetical protein
MFPWLSYKGGHSLEVSEAEAESDREIDVVALELRRFEVRSSGSIGLSPSNQPTARALSRHWVRAEAMIMNADRRATNACKRQD